MMVTHHMRSGLSWLMAALLAASLLPACSGKSSETSAGKTLSAPAAAGMTGVSLRAKKSQTLEISRATPEGSQPSDLEKDTWTVFVYLCGSDLESENAAATLDLSEMVAASGSEQVSFVVQTGGASSWSYDEIDASLMQRLFIQDGSIMEVDSVPVEDMGESETLADFLSWGIKNYPADKMGVVLWNHGGGSLAGVCFDENYDDDTLVLRELDEAFASVLPVMWEKFEFVGLDACLMSTLETANILATYANYLYASEEWEPGTGWDYTQIMEYLAQTPSANGADLGKTVCDSYMESLDESEVEIATFAITDLSRVDDLLVGFNAFAQEMFEATADSSTLATTVRGIVEADNFGGNNRAEGYANMVDLGGLVKAAQQAAPSAAQVLEELQKAVVYHREGDVHKEASGLSLYYPLELQSADELTLFEQVCVSPYYLSFVDRQAHGGVYGTQAEEDYDDDTWFIDDLWSWLGTDAETGEVAQSAQDDDYWSYVDENDETSSVITFAKEPQLDDDGVFGFQLDEEGLENTSSVSALVYTLSDDGEDVIALGETYDVGGDWSTGEFYDQFDGFWLSLPDGQNLASYVAESTDTYDVYACPVELNGEETNLRVRVYWEDYETLVEGAWDGISETGESGRGITKIEKGDVIVPLYDAFGLESDDESVYTGDEYTVDDDFAAVYDFLYEGEYFYAFVVTDVFGSYYTSDFVEFDLDENGDITFYA